MVKNDPERMSMDKVIEVLQEHDALVIVGHRDPDGDSLGSSMALGLALEQMGKRVAIISADPLFAAYQRLPDSNRVRVVSMAPDGFQVAVFMECNAIERSGIGGFDDWVIVNIDHHANNPDFGDVNWVDPSMAAVGVMVYRLLTEIDVDITPAIATHLYVAILTDTGSFRYSNTDAEAFRICGELVELGVDPASVAEAIYENVPMDKVRLLAAGLGNLRLEAGGRVASMVLDYATLESSPGKPDTEGIVNHGKAIDGVSVSLLFKEVELGQYRISLRSDESVDVAAIAGAFGGGGHPRAAGCMVSGDLTNTRREILSAVYCALGIVEKDE